MLQTKFSKIFYFMRNLMHILECDLLNFLLSLSLSLSLYLCVREHSCCELSAGFYRDAISWEFFFFSYLEQANWTGAERVYHMIKKKCEKRAATKEKVNEWKKYKFVISHCYSSTIASPNHIFNHLNMTSCNKCYMICNLKLN
jgi:hypothetical protein